MIDKLKQTHASASFGVAVSVMLSIVLMFSGLRLYQVTSIAASAQESADVAVVAAEGEVAKFYTVANTADTAILCMNATQYAMWGISVVMACTGNPAGSAEMLAYANRVGTARTNFSTKAKRGLNAYQTALPFIAAAKASSLVSENELEGDDAKGVSVLVPMTGENIAIDTDDLSDAEKRAQESVSEAQKRGEELKSLSDAMDEKKSRAYQLDCGDNPGYCLYERAKSLATMQSGSNPFYASADSWDFNVAFNRSLAYFKARLSVESPSSQTSVREQSRSYLRKDYYSWVVKKLQECKTSSTGAGSLYDWPEIYHDARGFRESERYHESIYPITFSDDQMIMHSNPALPCANGASEFGSCADYDDGDYVQCTECLFSASNTGNIGSATTNTQTGFEHYFQEIYKLKKEYDEAKKKYDEEAEKMRGNVDDASNKLSDFLNAAKKARISVSPPGREGAVLLSTTNHVNKSSSILNAFVTQNSNQGTTFSISGAKLETDERESGFAIVAKRLKSQNAGAASSIWNSILDTFSSGNSLNSSVISDHLGGGVLGDVASYALGKLGKVLDSAGLAPADWSGKKPIIVNTDQIVENEADQFARIFKQAQNTARQASVPSTDFSDSLKALSNSKIDSMFSGASVDIASVDVPIIGKVAVTVNVGDLLSSNTKSLVNSSIDKISALNASSDYSRSWQ